MGRVLLVKVIEKGSSRARYEYKNRINLEDPSQIFLILSDLRNIFNAPIKKACLQFLDKKEKIFPV